MNWEIQEIYEELINQKDKLIETLAEIQKLTSKIEYTCPNDKDICIEAIHIAHIVEYMITEKGHEIIEAIDELIDNLEKARMID